MTTRACPTYPADVLDAEDAHRAVVLPEAGVRFRPHARDLRLERVRRRLFGLGDVLGRDEQQLVDAATVEVDLARGGPDQALR